MRACGAPEYRIISLSVTNRLTKVTERREALYWSELDGDSALGSLRFPLIGWMPGKQERVMTRVTWYALAVLWGGSGTFRAAGDARAQPAQAPGFFMHAPGMRHDYGPVGTGRWDEFFWTFQGERVREWQRGGWWHQDAQFVRITAEEAETLRGIFERSCAALEIRDRAALDGEKLAIERWLAARAQPAPAAEGALGRIVERWRREPQRAWSLQDAAADAGLSYSRFRVKFLADFGTSPYDYLLRLRIELAERWLTSTDEAVKVIAQRCGFGGAEAFVRAFGRVHGQSPGRWRKDQSG